LCGESASGSAAAGLAWLQERERQNPHGQILLHHLQKKELVRRTKRKLDVVDKELEDQFPKESTQAKTQA